MLTLRQAAGFCGGTVLPEYADVRFTGAQTDSRLIRPGELFVALKGARDGHEFAAAAIEQGAAAVLGERQLPGVPMIIAADSRLALGAIAAGWRGLLKARVVAITGSVGKTTTKEMTAAVLETTFRTQKTQKNFNNDLGLPMTVLGVTPDCEAAVTELGMNHFGEISYLTAIARPDAAVVTNIGTMHIENLGSREGILKAKLEILEGLRPGGTVFFNGDEPLLRAAPVTPGPIFFGLGADNDVRAEDIVTADGETRFTVKAGEDSFAVMLPLEGEHNVCDALAAIAVGLRFGVTPERIAAALASFRNTGERQNIYTQAGVTVISDCYNAGPESMAAALSVLRRRSCPGRRIAVLGDMLELGAHADAAHTRVGALAAQSADRVFAYGPHAALLAAGDRAQTFETHEALARALADYAEPGDTLLFKGSHGMHMERALALFFREYEQKRTEGAQ